MAPLNSNIIIFFQFFDAREYNTDAEASDLSSEEDGEMEDAEDDRGSVASSESGDEEQVGGC